MLKKRIAIIGNGIAGFSAASAARRLMEDAEIVMIAAEKEPLYSACVLPDYISGKISRERTFVKGIHDYENLSIATCFGREAKEIDLHDRRIRLDDGESVHFNALILALGSRAIETGERKQGAFSIKTLADADALVGHKGRKAVVVGSGAIGVEVAIGLKQKNYDVTILELLPRILPLGLDQKASDKVQGVLNDHGIKVILNEKAIEIAGEDNVEGLKTNRRELECDTIIWAIGMKPNVDIARDAGIKIGIKGGIDVDSHMETNIDGVYACGDCAEAIDIMTGKPALNLFWHNANRQGAVAGSNSIGCACDYPGSENLLNLHVFAEHVAAFGRTVSALKLDGVDPGRISVIEGEEGKAYSRIVFLDGKCAGAQFVNPPKDACLIWNLIRNGKHVNSILNVFRSERALRSLGWISRVSPFFRNKNLVEGD